MSTAAFNPGAYTRGFEWAYKRRSLYPGEFKHGKKTFRNKLKHYWSKYIFLFTGFQLSFKTKQI